MTVLAILGPTASGKSDLAMEVALRTGARILSVDSMQVYRGMDIGTAKPGPEARAAVEHGMIDVADPEDLYSVAEFQRDARAFIESGQTPVIIAGGSGLHFRATVDPFTFDPTDPELRAELEGMEPAGLVDVLVSADPDAGEHVDLANPRRVIRAVEILRLTGVTPSRRAGSDERRAVEEYEALIPVVAYGVDRGEDLDRRIAQRLAGMRRAGLLDEVADLAPRLGLTARQAVGYKELLPVVKGDVSEDDGFEAAAAATRGLARRQRTWFRKDPRISWVDPESSEVIRELVEAVERAS